MSKTENISDKIVEGMLFFYFITEQDQTRNINRLECQFWENRMLNFALITFCRATVGIREVVIHDTCMTPMCRKHTTDLKMNGYKSSLCGIEASCLSVTPELTLVRI